jgi:hypothetical protein
LAGTRSSRAEPDFVSAGLPAGCPEPQKFFGGVQVVESGKKEKPAERQLLPGSITFDQSTRLEHSG